MTRIKNPHAVRPPLCASTAPPIVIPAKAGTRKHAEAVLFIREDVILPFLVGTGKAYNRREARQA